MKGWNSTPSAGKGFKQTGGSLNRKTGLKRTTSRIKPKKGVSKLPALRIWSVKKADEMFSLEVRNRDGKCLYPNCGVKDLKKLQCSHWNGRRHNATRFDPENCITLCYYHHYGDKLAGFEYAKQRKELHGFDGKYTEFMQTWLGSTRYNLLLLRSMQSRRSSDAIIELMERQGALHTI